MLRKLMEGRYGIDNLTLALVFISAIVSNIRYVWVIGIAFTGYAIFRIISKKRESRLRELKKYNDFIGSRIERGLFKLYRKAMIYKTRLQQRKLYVFVKCGKCGNTLRLPKNKGKLSVTCPVCKAEFVMKT